MNELDIVESIRPDVGALSQTERASIRAEVFGHDFVQCHDDGHQRDDVEPPVLDVHYLQPGGGRDRWLAIAAAVLAVAGVAGVWAAGSRHVDQPLPPAAKPAETLAPAPVTVADDGRVTAGPLPAGWHLVHASERATAGSDEFVQRIYATSDLAPERQAALTVTSIPERLGSPVVPETSTPVTVQGVPGHSWPIGANRHSVAFGPIDGFFYRVVSTNLSLEQTLASAEAVHQDPGGYGAVIDPAVLPDGVVEQAAGFESEVWFISRDAATEPITEIGWGDGADGYVFIMTLEQDAATMALSRLAFDEIDDATVHGHPGYRATYTQQATPFHAVAWSDGDRSYIVGSITLGLDQVEAIAATVRPATREEWAAMTEASPLADVNPTAATTVVEDVADPVGLELLEPTQAYGSAVWNARET